VAGDPSPGPDALRQRLAASERSEETRTARRVELATRGAHQFVLVEESGTQASHACTDWKSHAASIVPSESSN